MCLQLIRVSEGQTDDIKSICVISVTWLLLKRHELSSTVFHFIGILHTEFIIHSRNICNVYYTLYRFTILYMYTIYNVYYTLYMFTILYMYTIILYMYTILLYIMMTINAALLLINPQQACIMCINKVLDSAIRAKYYRQKWHAFLFLDNNYMLLFFLFFFCFVLFCFCLFVCLFFNKRMTWKISAHIIGLRT